MAIAVMPGAQSKVARLARQAECLRIKLSRQASPRHQLKRMDDLERIERELLPREINGKKEH